jgi:hypothetical protein
MPRNKNVVSDERKASMKRYNDSITAEQKQQNAMTKLFQRLQTGQTQKIQKNTLTKFPWTEQEKTFLKKFIPQKDNVRQQIIRGSMDDVDSDSDDEQPPQEPEMDYEQLLHCDEVMKYMNTRTNYKPSRVSSSPTISIQTRTQDKSNAKTLCVIYKTTDFREILNDDPKSFYEKVASYIIPNGKSKGKTYDASTRLKKLAVIFTLLNEYEPAISYVKNKTNHDFETYYNELEEISTQNARTSQSDTLQKRITNITGHEELLNELKQLFGLEQTLKEKSLKSLEDNLNYIIILMFSYGCFNKSVKPENVAFIPRLSIDKIAINNTRSSKVEGDTKVYHRRTGRMYIKGSDALKTGKRYSFDYIVTPYVKKQLSLSINKFPRDILLDQLNSEKIGKQLSKLIRANTTMKSDTNTKIRHLYETIFKVLKVDELTISSAMAHDPFTGDVIYTEKLKDEFNDEKRQTIVDFFNELAEKN